MKQLISDESKFKKLTQNPTKSREDSLITYLRKLKRDGVIDDETLTFVFSRVLLFPETKSRETSGLEGKQN